MQKIRDLTSREERKIREMGLSINMEKLVRESWEATENENRIWKNIRFHLIVANMFVVNLALAIFVPFKNTGAKQGQY